MRRTLTALSVLLACLLPATASATWSIIAVDLSTRRVVIASATCVNQNDMFLMGVQAVVVPGIGVAACQASVDGTKQNQMLVFRELQKGTDPKQIIELLSADPAFQSRQFGILDLTGRSAGHTGLANGYVGQDVQGRVPGTDIYYSIQGNILRPGQVVPNAEAAFLKTSGAITDRVMAAMEAGDASGGDSRCSCPPPPADGSKPAIACDSKTAHVAYILMADANDANGQSHNDGKYAMYLTVSQPGENRGPGAIREGENLNPVKTLRMRYDVWRKTQPATPPPPGAQATAQAAGQRGGGGGRGRGAMQIMTLTAPWAPGAEIPLKYTQAGDETSPALSWTTAPETAGSFVLIVHDVSAPTSPGTDDVLHWLVWNIPGAARSLPEGVPQGPELPDGTRQISVTGPNYRGPGASGPPHVYVFELFALDGMLDIPALGPAGANVAQTRAAVIAAMAGRVRGKAVTVGTFNRK